MKQLWYNIKHSLWLFWQVMTMEAPLLIIDDPAYTVWFEQYSCRDEAEEDEGGE